MYNILQPKKYCKTKKPEIDLITSLSWLHLPKMGWLGWVRFLRRTWNDTKGYGFIDLPGQPCLGVDL